MRAEFNTITGRDWREMFARARAAGAAEGNLALMQIRAAAAQFRLSSQPGSLAGERSAGDRRVGVITPESSAEAGCEEAISKTGSHPLTKASAAACES